MHPVDHSKIVLVHPLGYSSGKSGRDISRMANIMPPLGLCGLASYLEHRGLEADIVDFNARPDSVQRLKDILIHKRPAYIGFSCTTSSFLDGIRLARESKTLLPDIRVVFGGVHVSSLGEEMMHQHAVIDYAVVGEGEETLAQLMQNCGHAPGIPGLIYREPGNREVVFTGRRPLLDDLDELPYPAYEKLEGFPKSYPLPIFNYPKSPNTSAITSRGCPYSCSYCDRSVFQKSYRFNSAEYIYEHMRYLNQHFKVRHINFYDDQFSFKLKRLERLTDMLVNRPLNMSFNCAVRSEHLTESLLKRLKDAGCWMISLGIESGDQDMLHALNRKVNLEKLAERVRLIKKYGIRVKGLLMIGMPGETEASVEKTRQFLFSLPVDDFNLTKFTPFPGAPVYRTIREYGDFQEDWSRMDCMHFLFVPQGFTLQRLEELHRSFYRDHFKRPRVLVDYAAMLWNSPDSWRRFVLNLGSFIRFARSGERFSREKQA
ncbi:Radical SAM domain protein [Desulfonatronospira thiodismutans ASO3-1]|uniref:Radical SAM domain protein n=1 Tax=Desulfonatronospira thiodismutans ASO3-1 TaxID=555779 RepID=D6SRZ7_9BACT|nr:radical SAM protein [Desulfonatronospira thiodismutans]EFI33463.1 Radical SAM domain protein [Desulfonatronospira thiodismutans ASO3-1]